MRVTNKMASDRVMSDIYRSMRDLMNAQEKLSSTKRINRPSDDPFGTHRAISSRSQLMYIEQYRTNVRETSGWVSTSDGVLNSVVGTLQEARTLAVQASNGILDATARANIANVVDGLRATLFQLSSEKYAGRYIFSGSETGAVPFTWTGADVTYNGNAEQMSKNVAPGSSVEMNVTGDEVFGGPGANVFKTLFDLAQAMRSGSAGSVGGYLTDIDESIDTVLDKLGKVGSTANRLEKTDALLAGFAEREKGLLSESEDLDLAEGVMDMQIKQNAYQATLAAASKVILPSLLDYMR